MALPENRKRARSEDEKEARRDAILAAAEQLIVETGLDQLTMNAIAQRAGVSKGTLYLYARTKEEILLALFVSAMDAVVQRIENQARAENLAEVLTQTPEEVPLFLPLLARLHSVIEINVGDEALFSNKRRMQAIGQRVASVIARLTGAPMTRAVEASMVLMLAMQGASQLDIGAHRKLESIPADLARSFTAKTFANSFGVAVRMTLAGLPRQ